MERILLRFTQCGVRMRTNILVGLQNIKQDPEPNINEGENNIAKAIKSLPNNKTPGGDNTAVERIKYYAEKMTKPLTKICNTSGLRNRQDLQ